MKYLYVLLFATAMIPFCANAQFSEDFQDSGLPANTYGFLPDSWGIYDEDGNTVSANLNYMVVAWELVHYSNMDGNIVAVSTSWYSPPGQSDDWMVTPQINVPADNPFLLFKAMAPDQDFADDYEVLISTAGNTPADFSTVIHSETSPPATLTPVSIDLTAYAGQQVYIAFRNVATDEYLLYIDDIEVTSLTNKDLAIEDLEIDRFGMPSTDHSLEVRLKNLGMDVINSADITWNHGTDSYTYSVSGLSLGSAETTTITHDTPVTFSSEVTEGVITVTISNINGSEDNNIDNNTETINYHTLSQSGTKHVVIEEGTGTWCGWCPRGIVAMEHMYENEADYPNFIGIAVHNGDPMVVPEYDSGAGIGGFPGSNVGREIEGAPVNTSQWIGFYNARKDLLTPADVSISSNNDQGEIIVDVSATFYSDYSESDFRLAVVVVEDGVTGTTGGYAQVNYYSGGAQGPMGGFENLPNPIPASLMVYDRVGIALLGGYEGEQGSVPDAITDGDVTNYSFTYTLPSTSNADNIHLVALLLNEETGQIVNAIEAALGSSASVENPIAIGEVQVYPNPASNLLNVSFGVSIPSEVRMSIYNTAGALVKTVDYGELNGQQNVQVDVGSLSSGTYLVSLATGNGSVAKTIIIE